MAEVKLVLFLIFATALFFLPNGLVALGGILALAIGLGLTLIRRREDAKKRRFWRSIGRSLPFVIFVIICNGLLSSWSDALWIGAKLSAVCALSIAYASTSAVSEIASSVSSLLRPLQVFGLTPEDTYLLVIISLMLIPILRRTFRETREACLAKGRAWGLSVARAVLLRVSWQMLENTTKLECALAAKNR